MGYTQSENKNFSAPTPVVKSLHILTVMNCSRYHKSGMPTVCKDLSAVFTEYGCRVENIFIEDIPGLNFGKLNQLLFGMKLPGVVNEYEKQYGVYDVIMVWGGEGWFFPLLRKSINGTRRLLVTRTGGLEHRYWQAYLAEVKAGREKVTPQHRFYFGIVRLKQVEQTIRHCDYFIGLTTADTQYAVARGWIKNNKVLATANGIHPMFFTNSAKPVATKFRILFSGSWTWMKGRTNVVTIFSILAQRYPQLELSIVGCNTSADTVRSFFPQNLWHRLRIEPGIPHEQMREEYQNHDLLLFTSLFEGYGNVVPEAMASGLPVVAAQVGCVPDLIKHGENGFALDPQDTTGFVEAVELILNNPNLAGQIGRTARQTVQALSWYNKAKEMLAVFHKGLEHVAN